MSFKNENKKNNSFLDKDKKIDKSVSDAINEAFDQVELSSVGKLCLDARLNKGLTQEQAGTLLKVRVKIIKDFENGEHIDLPGLAYKVGFVRSYARLLDLDGDLLVKEFKESLELTSFKEEYKFLTPELNKNNFLPIGVVVSVFIAILSYTGWYYSDRSNKIETVSDQKTEEIFSKTAEIENNSYVIIEENFPNNSPTSKTNDEKKVQELNSKITLSDNKVETMISKNTELSATANERDPSTEMVLKATGNSWVEIEDLDGNLYLTRLMRSGETFVVPDKKGLTLSTGNAGALSLTFGSIHISKLGSIGEVISSRPLNIEAFKKR
jgi:cytoskeleton protein RodZ